MDASFLRERLETARATFDTLERQLADPDVAANPAQLEPIARERARLEPLVNGYDQLCQWRKQEEDAKELLKESRGDQEMEALAQEELSGLATQIAAMEEQLTLALLPRDPRDERSVMLEIRAGAGGDEAAIWAGDLARMYERYAQSVGWKVQPVSASEAELGGYKELILAIQGDSVFSQLKFEAGVHRVQRVPATESQGRVHTSTATVAVMPEADPVEVQIDPTDLEISTARSRAMGSSWAGLAATSGSANWRSRVSKVARAVSRRSRRKEASMGAAQASKKAGRPGASGLRNRGHDERERQIRPCRPSSRFWHRHQRRCPCRTCA